MDDFEEEIRYSAKLKNNDNSVTSIIIVGNSGMGKTYHLKYEMGWDFQIKRSWWQLCKYFKRKKLVKKMKSDLGFENNEFNRRQIKEIYKEKMATGNKMHYSLVQFLEILGPIAVKFEQKELNSSKINAIYLNCFEIQKHFEDEMFRAFIERKVFKWYWRYTYYFHIFLERLWHYFLGPFLVIFAAFIGATFSTRRSDDSSSIWTNYWFIVVVSLASFCMFLLIIITWNAIAFSRRNFFSKNPIEIDSCCFSKLRTDLILIFDDLDRIQDEKIRKNLVLKVLLLKENMMRISKDNDRKISIIAVTNRLKSIENIEDKKEEIKTKESFLKETDEKMNSSDKEFWANVYYKSYDVSRNKWEMDAELSEIDFYNKYFNFIFQASLSDEKVKEKIMEIFNTFSTEYESGSNLQLYESEFKYFFDKEIKKWYWDIIVNDFNGRKIKMMLFEFARLIDFYMSEGSWMPIIWDKCYFANISLDYAFLKIYQPNYFFKQEQDIKLLSQFINLDTEKNELVFKNMFYTNGMRKIIYNLFSQLTMPNRTVNNLDWSPKVFDKLQEKLKNNNDFFSLAGEISTNPSQFLINSPPSFLLFFYRFINEKNKRKEIDFSRYKPTVFTTFGENSSNYSFACLVLHNGFGEENKISSIFDVLEITDKEIFKSFSWIKKKLIFKIFIARYVSYSEMEFSLKESSYLLINSNKYDNLDNPFFLEKNKKRNFSFPKESIFIKKIDSQSEKGIISLFNKGKPFLPEDFDFSILIESLRLERDIIKNQETLTEELIDIFSLNPSALKEKGYQNWWENHFNRFSVFIWLVSEMKEKKILSLDSIRVLNSIFNFISFIELLESGNAYPEYISPLQRLNSDTETLLVKTLKELLLSIHEK